MTPILAALLMMIIVGIPHGVLLLALYLMSLYVARIYVMAWAGQLLLAWSEKPIHPGWPFVCGLAVYTALGLIPIVRVFVSLSAGLFGMGALLDHPGNRVTKITLATEEWRSKFRYDAARIG